MNTKKVNYNFPKKNELIRDSIMPAYGDAVESRSVDYIWTYNVSGVVGKPKH